MVVIKCKIESLVMLVILGPKSVVKHQEELLHSGSGDHVNTALGASQLTESWSDSEMG